MILDTDSKNAIPYPSDLEWDRNNRVRERIIHPSILHTVITDAPE